MFRINPLKILLISTIQIFLLVNGSVYVTATNLSRYSTDLYENPNSLLSSSSLEVLPIEQSGFLINRMAEFSITITNNNTSPDTFAFSSTVLQGESSWSVVFINPTNGLPMPDSGLINSGQSAVILIRMIAPSSSVIGQYSKIKISFSSISNPLLTCDAWIQGAIPAPFVQLFTEGTSGVDLELITKENRRLNHVNPKYDDAYKSAIAQIEPDGYWYFTVLQQLIENFQSNIQFVRSNAFTRESTLLQLTNNVYSEALVIKDVDPAIDISNTSSAITGIAFTRTLRLTTDGRNNNNIYVGLVSKTGITLCEPIKITDNNKYGDGTNDPNVPFYLSVKIAAISDNFLLSWVVDVIDESGYHHSDIMAAVVQADGCSIIKSPFLLTESTTTLSFLDPSIQRYDSGKAILTYFSTDTSLPPGEKYKLWISIMDQNGNLSPDYPKLIGNIYGRSLDMVKIGSNVLLSWEDSEDLVHPKIRYMFLNAADDVFDAPSNFENPDNRKMDSVSVTYDYSAPSSRGILTWQSNQKLCLECGERFYFHYALVDVNGIIVTPPMIYKVADGIVPIIRMGAAGGGIAPLAYSNIWTSNLPVIAK